MYVYIYIFCSIRCTIPHQTIRGKPPVWERSAARPLGRSAARPFVARCCSLITTVLCSIYDAHSCPKNKLENYGTYPFSQLSRNFHGSPSQPHIVRRIAAGRRRRRRRPANNCCYADRWLFLTCIIVRRIIIEERLHYSSYITWLEQLLCASHHCFQTFFIGSIIDVISISLLYRCGQWWFLL